MVNLLASLLGPIFEPMGVSQADLLSYIGMVQSYVWVILIAIVALIVVLILAKNAQKGKKHLIRWSAVLAWLAIVALTVNLMCYGPLKNNISTFLNASKAELTEETIAQSKDIIYGVTQAQTKLPWGIILELIAFRTGKLIRTKVVNCLIGIII